MEATKGVTYKNAVSVRCNKANTVKSAWYITSTWLEFGYMGTWSFNKI